MAKNVKDTKHTRHIDRILNFVRIGKKCKMHQIEWCEGGLHNTAIKYGLINLFVLHIVYYIIWKIHYNPVIARTKN